MSLIDDALKRAQAADAAARPADRPWIPTPMPDPAIARRRAIARWLGILAAVAVAAAAGAWLVKQLTPATPERPAALPTPPAAAAAALLAATPTPDAVALATPIVVAPGSAALPPAEVTPRPTRRPRPTPAPSSAEPPPAGEPADVAAAPPAPAPVPPTARPARDASGGRTYPGVAALPGGTRIELGGIVWSETEPRALLNDRILGIGSYVEGWSVHSISEDRVVLEKDGATITITVK